MEKKEIKTHTEAVKRIEEIDKEIEPYRENLLRGINGHENWKKINDLLEERLTCMEVRERFAAVKRARGRPRKVLT